MLISPGIAMLSITAPVLSSTDTVYPILLWDDENIALIDTGYPGQLEQLQKESTSYGIDFKKLNKILITHQDIDHIGNLQELVEKSSGSIEVSTHQLEKPYVQGDKRILRFTDEAIAKVELLPDTVPATFREGLKRLMLHPPKAKVDHIINERSTLSWCGGITTIETPGHTPGHISFYHQPTRTLIAGDALIVKDGQLYGPDPTTTLDKQEAENSIKKLLNYNIEAVVCYHGGLFKGDVKERLKEISLKK